MGGNAKDRATMRSLALRARHHSVGAQSTQVAARGRTLGGDISRSRARMLGKRDAEERGEGFAAETGAKRARRDDRKIH